MKETRGPIFYKPGDDMPLSLRDCKWEGGGEAIYHDGTVRRVEIDGDGNVKEEIIKPK